MWQRKVGDSIKKKIIAVCSLVLLIVAGCSFFVFASDAGKEFLGEGGKSYTVRGLEESDYSESMEKDEYHIGDDMGNGYRVIGIAEDGSILAEPIE